MSSPDGAALTNIGDLYLGWFRTRLGETTPDKDGNKRTWQQLGFDLDGLCSNSATCGSIRDAVSCKSSTPGRVPFDGELCRDNTFGSLQAVAAAVPELGEHLGLKQSRVNCGLWRGEYTIVMKISGYNGAPDDPEVRLDLYSSPGLARTPPWQCPLDNFETSYPRWRQPAAWFIDSAGLKGPIDKPGTLPDAIANDAHAYVRDGYLVASFPGDVLLRFMGDGMPYRGFALNLHRSIWTGRLSRGQDQTWSVSDGVIGAALRENDFVRAFREVGLCERGDSKALYEDVLGYIRENVDLLADGEVDPERPCDAISLAVGFEAGAITPGGAKPVLPLVECCPPDVPLADCSSSCGDGRVSGEELCDIGIAQGEKGACPTSCTSPDPCIRVVVSGEGCRKTCTEEKITKVGAADGCCPSNANATIDTDCRAKCGNLVVEATETCDPPSSCTCKSTDACLEATSTGAAESCNLGCKLSPKTMCRSGDGCCPSGCNATSDSDCSSSCGNGTVEAPETCEPNGPQACAKTCDDADPCTLDVQTGTAAQCNVVCTHTPVTAPQAGDGCCPAGASSITDSDCAAECGNSKLDAMEQCDDGNTRDGDGCSARCTQETASERCRAIWKPGDADCASCTCDACANPTLSCLLTQDERTRTLCTQTIACASRTGCVGLQCYCGSASPGDCLLPGLANGPCRGEIERAAGTTIPPDVLAASANPGTPLGLSWSQRTCVDANCPNRCGP